MIMIKMAHQIGYVTQISNSIIDNCQRVETILQIFWISLILFINIMPKSATKLFQLLYSKVIIT
jgi:hypothetical protein